MSRELVPAVGGERLVPAPDPIARDYVLLALRLDQRLPGLVDANYGPAELKAQVETEQLRSPVRLREDAASLIGRLDAEVEEGARRRWLAAQLVALEAQALALAGDPLGYQDFVTCCFQIRPERVPESVFDAAADELDRLLPADGPRGRDSLPERVEAWDARFVVGPDRVPAVADWLLERFRAATAARFGLPPGETVQTSYVEGQPWSAYNWFDGGARSRVDVNLDLPIRAADLVHLLSHEAYPGHHTEHSWKERVLLDEQGRVEASVQLINTPECLISEGLADLGERFVAPEDELPDLLVELYERAGLPIAADPIAARAAAELQVRIRLALSSLRAVPGNAALMLHDEGTARPTVLEYIRGFLVTTPERAAKRLSFIEHPLWRAYVFVYYEGERLLRNWLEAAPSASAEERFGRLLREQLTPAAILEETAARGG